MDALAGKPVDAAVLRGYQARIAMAGFIGMMVSVAPILFSSFPVLLQPVSGEFGWGRGKISFALFAAMASATLLYPVIGALLDRFGSRAILLPGFGLFGLSVIGLSLMNGSTLLMLGLYALAGAMSTMASGVAIARALSRVFFGRRGIMLSLCLGVGGGIGGAAIPLATRFLVDAFGWRGAYLGLGLLPIALGMSAVFFLLHEPAEWGEEPLFRPFGPTAREVRRGPLVWLLLFSIFLTCAAVAGVQAHFIAIATDRGVDPTGAAAMFSAGAIGLMVGQFLIGFALDRMRSPWIIRAVYCVLLLGVVLVHLAGGKAFLLAGIALIGLAAGSEYGLLPYYLTRLFGLRSFGQLYGLVYAAAAVANGLGPVLMGLTFDRFHSYDSAFLVFEVGLTVSVLCGFAIRSFAFTPEGGPMRAAGQAVG